MQYFSVDYAAVNFIFFKTRLGKQKITEESCTFKLDQWHFYLRGTTLMQI